MEQNELLLPEGEPMKGLLLCGGRGTRLRPFSFSRPKHLLPVGNRPVIAYAISQMREVGITQVGIVVPPHFKSQFEASLGSSWEGVSLTYIVQPEPKGLADAVQQAREFAETQPLLVYLGDNCCDAALAKLVQRYRHGRPAAVLLTSQVDDPRQFGVVEFTGDLVSHVVEKPENPSSNWAVAGVYLLSPQIFDVIPRLAPSARGELELTDAIQTLIEEGEVVRAVRHMGWWLDIGNSESLLQCNRQVLKALRTEAVAADAEIVSSRISGPVEVGRGCRIVDSVIEGPVVIGANTTITRARIGPYVSIGPGAYVAESQVVDSVVMEQVRLSNVLPPIESSVIGQGVVMEGDLFTADAVQMQSGAVRVILGDFSHICARPSLAPEGAAMR